MPARKALGAVVALLSILAAGCGAAPAKTAPATTSAPAHPAPAAAQSQPNAPQKTAAPTGPKLTPLTFQLEWRVSSQHVGFIVAKARGYFRQAGLDVKIVQGKGSGVTLQMIGAGEAPLGGADAATAALGITRGIPVKVIATILQESPSAFLYHSGLHFTDPTALRGQTLIAAPGNTNIRLLPAVLNRYHTSVKALGAHVELLSPRAEYAAFLKNKKSVYLGYVTNSLANLRQHDPNVRYKLYAAYGINVLGTSLIASDAEIKAHPAVLSAFMAASAKGWAYTRAHPRQAVAEVVKLFPQTKAAPLLTALRTTFSLLHTPASKGHPFGWMAKSDWQSTIDLLHRYMGLKHPKPLSAYYTDRFIAGGA